MRKTIKQHRTSVAETVFNIISKGQWNSYSLASESLTEKLEASLR